MPKEIECNAKEGNKTLAAFVLSFVFVCLLLCVYVKDRGMFSVSGWQKVFLLSRFPLRSGTSALVETGR